ncbi:hypothetical protein NPIL_292251, partial [Nephila pilipes]
MLVSSNRYKKFGVHCFTKGDCEDRLKYGRILSERDLRRYLFAHYDKLVRPVTDPNNTIVVKVAFALLGIRRV